MNTDDDNLKFSIVLDDSELRSQINESKSAFQELGDQAVAEGNRMDDALKSVGRTIASLGLAWSAQEFAQKVASVRGEFQQLEVAMETMLGSSSKAQTLMAQMVQTAATTPFGLQEVAGGAKQLLAYGLEAEKVNDTLIRLGDIAAGLSIPLGDLVYLYGTTMAQGRLYTQDLNQFTGRGIPMLKELAKQFGVAESEVKGLVEAGKVGFPQVQKVIESLTDEGGTFGGLMEKQSHTITGQISNIEDAFDMMFNEIGKESEGFINTALEGASWLVEHYKITAEALMTLVAAYGVYKGTLMATTAFTNAAYNYEATQIKALLAGKTAAMDADLAEAVAKGRLTAARAQEVQALRAELNAKIEEATVAERVAQAEMAQAQFKYESCLVSVSLSKMRVSQAQQELAAAQASGDATAIENAQTNLNTAIKNRNSASRQLSALRTKLDTATTNANSAAQTKNALETGRDTIAKKVNGTQTKLLTLANQGLTKALHGLKAAWASNPVGLILMGVTMVAGALMTMNDAMEETALESSKFGEAAAKVIRNVDTLFMVVNSTSATSKVHSDAIDELCKIYEEYGIEIDAERDKLEQLNATRQEVIDLIREEGEARDQANNIAAYDEAISKRTEKMKKDFLEAYQNAEWDMSGIFDDWDADRYQERAEELATIVGALVESEVAKHGDEVDALSIWSQIKKVYKDLGIEESYWATDINEGKIIYDYISKVNDLTSARQRLVDSYSESIDAVNEETKAVDVSTLSFSDLLDTACKAADKTGEVADNVGELDNKKAEPEISTTSIDNAILQTNTLLNLINSIASGPKLGEILTPYGTYNFLPTQNPTPTPAPTQNPALTQVAFETIMNRKPDTQAKAQEEMEKRLNEAFKTRQKTAETLKEVNAKLETAVVGSEEEAYLLSLRKRLSDQQKLFNQAENGGNNRTSRSNGETAEQRKAKIKKAEDEVNQLLQKSAEERESLMQKLAFTQQQNEINLENDAALRRKKQLELDQEKELADLEAREKSDIEAEKQRQKRLFDAQEAAQAAADKNYTKRNFSDDDIDQSQIQKIQDEYQTLYSQLNEQQRRAQADLLRVDFQAMNDYLVQYGEYQQQRLAIAEDYAKKISEASNEGERRSLEKERDSKLASVRAAELKENIDWTVVFGEFGGMFHDVIRPALDDLKEYVKTDEFKNSDAQSQKEIVEAMQQMEAALGSADRVSFEKLGTEISKYQKSLAELRTAQADYANKYAKLTEAQEAYTKAMESGSETEIETAKKAVATAQAEADTSAQNLHTLQTTVDGARDAVSQTATDLKTAMDNVVGGLQKLAGGSVSGVYEGLVQMGKGMRSLEKMPKNLSDAFGKISDTLENVPIIGWIAQIIDLFKDGVSVVISGILDAVFSAVSGIIGDILNFRDGLFRSVAESLGSGIMKIFESVFTLGGWWDWIGGGDSDPHLEEDMERLSQTNEALQRAIENLTEVMDDAAMFDVGDIYERQIQLINEAEANTQQQLARTGAAHSDGVLGIGGHHSSNKKIDEGMSADDWSVISKIVGENIRSAGDFWTLSSEQMQKLADEAPHLYAKIKDLADDGYKDAAQYMDDYIEFAKQREELEEAYREKLTNVSFDSLRDSFKDALTDMEMSASDFAEKFNELLTDSVAEALMSNNYDPLIKKLYEKWADFMVDDGMIDEDELRELQADRDAIYDKMQQDREFISMLSTGDTTQGQGSKSGFATASQDSIDELNGRFTAIQMDTSIIRETLSGITESMSGMNLSAAEIKQHTDEIRNLSLMAIDYLERITKNTNELPEMNERLGKIEKNTRRL